MLRGAGRLFSAGADITEFDRPLVPPFLADILDRIEADTRPIIAALHGPCLGGSLELALSCHYRVAAPSASIGLLPGAGGTQRLPRLVGVPTAAAMIISGDPVTADQAVSTGLIDRIVSEERLTEDAVAFAREVAVPQGAHRTCDRTVAAHADLFDDTVAGHASKVGGRRAPAACVEAIRAAVELPFRSGLARERGLFVALAAGRESMALRHLFVAERAAAKIDGMTAGVEPIPVGKVGVVGAGTMGGGIAMNFLSIGLEVVMVERQ